MKKILALILGLVLAIPALGYGQGFGYNYNTFKEQAAKPSSPPATYDRLYIKADGKVYTVNSAGTETEVGAGAGDVTGTGDCAGGACLDGSSDGGTYIRLYDGTSAYISVTGGVRTITLLPSNANAESLVITFGDNSNVVALSSGTGAAVNISGSAATATGNAGTATALAADPADCAAGQIALGITAAGAATCTATPSVTTLTGNVTGNVSGSSGSTTGNAGTATALAANGANCNAGSAPLGVDASGAVEGCWAVQAAGSYSTTTVATDTIFDAAGDLVQGTGANTAAKLTKGAEGTILRAGATSNVYSTSTFADTYAKGTFLYNAAANTVASLAHPGVANYLLYTNAVDTSAWLASSANMISLLGSADYATARTNLSLVPGTNVQAQDAELAAIAGLTFADASIIQLTGAAAGAVLTSGGNDYFLKSATDNSALMFATPAEVRTALGLVIGTNVQAYDADLAYLAGFTPSANVKTILNAADNAAIKTALGYYTSGDSPTFAGVTISKSTGVAGYSGYYEANSTDTSQLYWMGPASIAESVAFQFANAQPTAGQVMAFAAPTGTSGPASSKVSAQTWITPILGTYGATANTIGKRGADATTVAASGITEDGIDVNVGALNIVTTGIIKGGINTVVYSADGTLGITTAQAQHGTFFINTYAGTQVATLPAAAEGMSVCIKNGQGNARSIRVDTDGTDYIVMSTGARTSGAGDYYEAAAAAATNQICLVAFDATDWHVTSERGTWAEQ